MLLCYLTGAPNGVLDLILPVSSLSLIFNDGARSYCSLVVAPENALGEDIATRPDGEIVIEKDSVEIYRGNFDDFGSTTGARSNSYSIRSSMTTTNAAPVTVDLDRVIGEGANSYQERVFNPAKFISLAAGDSINYKSEVIPIRQIRITFSIKQFTQELTELIT